MKQLLLIILVAATLLSCQTPVKPVPQDNPALRHQIQIDMQNFALEAARKGLEQYQQRFPNGGELPLLRAALAERYLDQVWIQVAKIDAVSSDAALHAQLQALCADAEALGANPANLADAKNALEKRFNIPVSANSSADKTAKAVSTIADKSTGAAVNGAAKTSAGNVVKAPKKVKNKAEKTAENSNKSEASSVSEEAKSEVQAAEASTKKSAVPNRREIRLNQADVEARSDIVAGMLKQISKHIVSEPVNVIIQSRSMKDFRWINALLKTSVQELDAQYSLSTEPVVDPTAAPAVILMAK